MKTLLIMRHAKSSWSNPSLSDHERPLKERGRRDAPMMGRLIRSQELTPGVIISSSAERALMTADAVADACSYEGELKITRELYHGDTEDYVQVIQRLGSNHDIIMVVGHNPGMEELLEQLVGQWHRLPTAALAEVQLDIEDWTDLTEDEEGELVNLWLPREVSR